MPRFDDILSAYRIAGAQERLDIYLAHPGLRGRFDGIERKEESGSRSGKAAGGQSRLRRMVRAFAAGWRASHS